MIMKSIDKNLWDMNITFIQWGGKEASIGFHGTNFLAKRLIWNKNSKPNSDAQQLKVKSQPFICLEKNN